MCMSFIKLYEMTIVRIFYNIIADIIVAILLWIIIIHQTYVHISVVT